MLVYSLQSLADSKTTPLVQMPDQKWQYYTESNVEGLDKTHR